MPERKVLQIDSKNYLVDVYNAKNRPASSTRVQVIIPTFLTSQRGFELTRVCVESLQRFSANQIDIWVVDNHSPSLEKNNLLNIEGINIVFNKVTPLKTNKVSHLSFYSRIKNFLSAKSKTAQMSDGSYANAIGLEIGVRLIPQDSELVFVMHNDCVALSPDWLPYLKSKLSDRVRAVGCNKDILRIQALHVSGILFDFQLIKKLQIDFLPDLPRIDVGDKITERLLAEGYEVSACKNTYNDPSLIDRIRADHPLKTLSADRCLDDNFEVIYAHLGRGTPKSVGHYKVKGKLGSEDWVSVVTPILEK